MATKTSNDQQIEMLQHIQEQDDHIEQQLTMLITNMSSLGGQVDALIHQVHHLKREIAVLNIKVESKSRR